MDTLSDGSQFMLNCTELNVTQLKNINMTRSTTAFACLIIVTVILLQICLFKAYKTVFQRMFLYLIVSAWILEAQISACIEHQFDYKGQHDLCKVYGFLLQWSVVSTSTFSIGIIIHLLYLVFSQIKGKSPTSRSQKLIYKTLELFYIVAVCIVPVTYLWIPFIHDNYGLAGSFCWMRALDKYCTNVGLEDQVIFGFGFSIISGIVGVFAIIALLVLYCRIAQHDFPEAKKLFLRTLILVIFLFAFILAMTLAFVIRLYTAINGRYQTYSVWIMHGVATPICHIIFPVGYLICFYSWNWFRWTTLKRAAMKNWKCCFACCKKTRPYEGPDSTVDVCTHPESSRVSDLSNTYFNLQYTNEFTQIESEADLELLQSQMNGNDAKYGSVTNT